MKDALERVEAAFIRKGVSISVAAKDIGVTRSALSKCLSGKSKLTIHMAYKLSRYTGVAMKVCYLNQYSEEFDAYDAIKDLREAVEEGEQSGDPNDFYVKSFIEDQKKN